MKEYMKYHIYEYMACLVTAMSLSYNIFSGFYISDSLRGNIFLLAAVNVLLQIILYLGTYNKKTAVLLSVGILLACGVFASIMISGKITIMDQEGSSTVIYIYYLVTIAVSVIVFALSRFRAGIAVIFISGAAITGALSFMEFRTSLIALIMFLIFCPVLYVMRNYRHGVINVSTVQPDFFRSFVSGIIIVAIAVGLSGGVYATIIKTIDPPVMDIKLITKYLSFEILDKTGMSQKYAITDEKLRSQNDSDTNFNSNKQGENESDTPQEQKDLGSTVQDDTSESEGLSTGNGDEKQVLESVSYGQLKKLIPIAVILLILILMLPFVIKESLRRYRDKKIMAQSKNEQIRLMYISCLRRWKHMDITLLGSDTPYEFLDKNKKKLQRFMADEGDIECIVNIFIKVKYALQDVSDDEYNECLNLYRSFNKISRSYLGTKEYIKKYMWL